MAHSRSVRKYFERKGILPTLRSPIPRLDPSELKVHVIPLQSPWPDPEYRRDVEGYPSPDRGPVQVWPPAQ